jgi:Fe-S cluster assembly protein SufD
MEAAAVRNFKDRFSLESVERLSAAFGDPDWLKRKRRKGWQAFSDFAQLPAGERHSGARWLKGPEHLPDEILETGEKLPLPAAVRPEFGGAWGDLAGAYSYGCESDFGALLDPEAAAMGVELLPLKQACVQRPELLERHLFSRTGEDESLYAALHAAYFGQGTLLYIPKGVRLAKPIRLRGVHTGGHAGFFPHTLVVAEEGAAATVVDEFSSAGEAQGLMAGVAELVLGPGSRVNYISLQDLNRLSGAAMRQNTRLADDAHLYTLGVVAGGAWSTSYLGSELAGGGGSVDLLGLALGDGARQIEIRTLQEHVGRAGSSDALVKSILRGASRFYFDGVVRIRRSGQSTNAYQSNPNLLLSSDARAESIPTLEIEADDVACKHAASIGGIDEEERFYLLSRGVPPRETETIITEGFASELAERLPEEGLKERFAEILNRLAMRAA